jgi:hypothetical protein
MTNKHLFLMAQMGLGIQDGIKVEGRSVQVGWKLCGQYFCGEHSGIIF